MIMSRLKSNMYADLGLIAGYFLREVRLVSGASSSRYHSLYSALVPLRDGPLHFTTDARGSEGHARDQGVRFLLSDEITADEFVRRLQAFDVDESPLLKILELAGTSDDAKQCHLPYRCLRLTRGVSSQPALVGSPTDVSTRLVMQLQRYRAEDSAVLDSNGSLSKETIMRSGWRGELQERRRRAFRNTQEKRRQNPLRLQASALRRDLGFLLAAFGVSIIWVLGSDGRISKTAV